MSAINGANQSLAALLRPTQLGNQFGNQFGNQAGTLPQGLPGNIGSKLTSFAEQAGYDPSAIANVQKDLQAAAEKVQAGGVDDPQAFIKESLAKSLEDNGIDAEKFRADLQSVIKDNLSGSLGSLGGLSSFGAAPSAGDQTSDLLDELFGDDDEADDPLATIIEHLNAKLPAGSLINLEA